MAIILMERGFRGMGAATTPDAKISASMQKTIDGLREDLAKITGYVSKGWLDQKYADSYADRIQCLESTGKTTSCKSFPVEPFSKIENIANPKRWADKDPSREVTDLGVSTSTKVAIGAAALLIGLIAWKATR